MAPCLIPLHGRDGSIRAHAIVSRADFAWARRYRWYLTSHRYARRTLPRSRRKSYLHREIMGLRLDDPRLVDHRDRNRLDCRRGNMRLVTKAQQQQNVSARRGTASGYRGVYQRRESGRWVAQVTKPGGARVTLGTYDTALEAARVAADFRRKHLPFSHETLPSAKARNPMLSFRRGTSKYRGVAWSKNAGKWMAYGRRDGRPVHLGYFDREIDAARAAAAWRETQ